MEKKQIRATLLYEYKLGRYNFLKPGEAVTAVKYCHESDEMHKKLKDLCPILVNLKGPILLHDNARPRVLQITVQKLNELGYETLPRPPYSQDLSPVNADCITKIPTLFSKFTVKLSFVLSISNVTSNQPNLRFD
ncbi:Histone-lysine N-methyltransferase SETMAR [Habropoda laboriosa]|uniref:Histone-lysine N-methyltransferase SETMAR n=1 Tax=Habropoda laboriosa TaxID=597456 RepID=A0A0L7QW38_9HYME|nr:Histone-lysine N-methyltransferase SETMAR [Habropoda laboriosa]